MGSTSYLEGLAITKVQTPYGVTWIVDSFSGDVHYCLGSASSLQKLWDMIVKYWYPNIEKWDKMCATWGQ